MDGQKLANLLQESQIPDTLKIKAITAELQKNYYNHPESLLLLIEILCTHGDVNVRQQAAVQAARLTPKHWKAIPKEQKGAVRQHLVEATMKEQNAKTRHSGSRLIAAIANIDFDNDEWPELRPALFGLANNSDVAQRAVGSYIIYSVLEANPTHFQDDVHNLLQLFNQTLKDPQSADVRINTLMSIGAMLMLVETDEDQQSVDAIQTLVPAMVDVLKGAAEANDDEKVKQAFEVLQQFLAYESVLLGAHLKDLLQFMIDLAANKNADDEVRSQALAFLAQSVRYRRMKIQAMRDMSAQLVVKSMQILTEIEDDEDDDDLTPARSALTLLDQLASDLPPRQVLVPLLDEFPKFSASNDASLRKAGILALGTCAEGAPDFVMTQLKTILPIILRLLNDPDGEVRHASLVGLTHLAEEMAEDLAVEHEAIIAALLKNLQAAMSPASDPKAERKNSAVIRSVCAAFDALSEGLKAETMKQYAHQLIDPIGNLLSHPDSKVKIAASGALGAIAGSLEADFKPYFEKTMTALGHYVSIKDSEEDLILRSGVCDSMGRIALAVGPQMFQPYVVELMKASEEGLHLDNERLRETSFILWSSLSRVYGNEFKPFLSGVFKGLFEALELEEDEVVINLTEEEKAIVGDSEELITGGKRVKLRQADDDENDDMGDEDDEEDWEDFAGAAEAMEKEVAVEVLGDVIANSCGSEEVKEYLEKAVEISSNLIDHPYEGIRKASVSTLWRSYARVWQLMEDETGTKWEPGFPPKQTPTPVLVKLGEMVTKPTMDLWAEEGDRSVVTEINRNISATLKACGPAILSQENMINQVITVLTLIITRSHPCQQDLGDDEEEQAVEESSEYDWLVIDTALDVVIGLAMALGPAFGELWKIFEKPIMKFASSNESYERSTAVGVIAECTGHMGSTVSEYTANLLRLLVHRLSDEDPETKSNAAYGIGQLIAKSEDSKTYLSSYNDILSKLERLLQAQEGGHRTFDNAAGCVCRMIMAHPDRVPIGEYLPVIVERLPLTEDFEENKPIYTCIFKLYEHNEPTVGALTPKFISLFGKVLSPPEEQLDDETRELIKHAIQILHKSKPELFQGHGDVLKLAGIA